MLIAKYDIIKVDTFIKCMNMMYKDEEIHTVQKWQLPST